MTPTVWIVTRAGAAHTHAILSLLPELMGAAVWPGHGWIAVDSAARSHVLGAAAFEPRLQIAEAPGFRGVIRVLQPWQRRGIGSALLSKLVEDVAAWGVDRLHTWQAAESAAQIAYLNTMGFAPGRAVHHFVGDLARGAAVSEQRVARLRSHGRIPPRFDVVPLAEVPLDAVATLYRSQLGGSIVAIRQFLRAQLLSEPCRTLSTAAWNGHQLASFLLMGSATDVPSAALWVSDPGWRHGWPAALVLEETLHRIVLLGARHYRFHCDETVMATMNFAKRSGARLESTQHHWTYRISGHATI